MNNVQVINHNNCIPDEFLLLIESNRYFVDINKNCKSLNTVMIAVLAWLSG